MPQIKLIKIAPVVVLCGALAAADPPSSIQGLIKTRNSSAMIMRTQDSSELFVYLTDYAMVGQVQGVFKARQKSMSRAALVPGLAVQNQALPKQQEQLSEEQRKTAES
jgi:hypothetical protein